jgi:hypothetical protein
MILKLNALQDYGKRIEAKAFVLGWTRKTAHKHLIEGSKSLLRAFNFSENKNQ